MVAVRSLHCGEALCMVTGTVICECHGHDFVGKQYCLSVWGEAMPEGLKSLCVF